MMLSTLALSVALAAAPVHARGIGDRPINDHIEHTAFIAGSPGDTRLPRTASRDPLNNGARIGAIVGGAVSGVAIAYLCGKFNDNESLHCWQPVLLWTAIGAGAGALVGAGVDALFERRVTIRWAVRF